MVVCPSVPLAVINFKIFHILSPHNEITKAKHDECSGETSALSFVFGCARLVVSKQ
jgi:hypothetical protein